MHRLVRPGSSTTSQTRPDGNRNKAFYIADCSGFLEFCFCVTPQGLKTSNSKETVNASRVSNRLILHPSSNYIHVQKFCMIHSLNIHSDYFSICYSINILTQHLNLLFIGLYNHHLNTLILSDFSAESGPQMQTTARRLMWFN